MSIDSPPGSSPALPSAGGADAFCGAAAAGLPAGAQRLSLAAGERCTLPAGGRWQVLEGLMALQPGPAVPAQPVALLGPGDGLAPEQPCVLLALQPMTGLLQPRFAGQAPEWPGAWRTVARTLQWLQWQTAQWALCGQHHSAPARAASWSLLASACAGPSRNQIPDPTASSAALPACAPRSSDALDSAPSALDAPGVDRLALPPLRWQPEMLRRGLGLGAIEFAQVRRALAAAGAWQEDVSSAAAASAAGAGALAARAPAASGVPLLAQPPALQRLACGCHRQLLTALQASATASATLMPSTPADRMPPA